MSWRNQGITGSNNIPLGTRRRFGGDSDGVEVKHEDHRDGHDSAFDGDGDRDLKRGRSPEPSEYHAPAWPWIGLSLFSPTNMYSNRIIRQEPKQTVLAAAKSAIDGAMPRRTKQLALWACLQLS